jgi:hypothetical protein
MAKLAIVATIKTVPGQRDEFDILVPQEEADVVMLVRDLCQPETFETHMPSLEASTIAWTWAIACGDDENPGRVVVISERNRFCRRQPLRSLWTYTSATLPTFCRSRLGRRRCAARHTLCGHEAQR